MATSAPVSGDISVSALAQFKAAAAAVQHAAAKVEGAFAEAAAEILSGRDVGELSFEENACLMAELSNMATTLTALAASATEQLTVAADTCQEAARGLLAVSKQMTGECEEIEDDERPPKRRRAGSRARGSGPGSGGA